MRPRTVLPLVLASLIPTITLAQGSGSSRPMAGSDSSRDMPWEEHPGTPAPPARMGERGSRSAAGARLASGVTEIVVQDQNLKGGYFFLYDPDVRKARALRHLRVHDEPMVVEPRAALRGLARVAGSHSTPPPAEGKPVILACSDFEDARTGEVLDVDVWMVEGAEGFRPLGYAIHKVAGANRYSLREDEMVPAR